MKGAAIEAFNISIGAAGAPTLVDNGKTGLVESVVLASAGLYTITLASPCPPKLVCNPQVDLSCISGTGAVNTVRYVQGSFNPTTRQFQIVVTDDEATPIAANPTNGVQISVLLVFQRYNV